MTEPSLVQFYERQFGPFVHMSAGDKAVWVRYLMIGGTEFAPFLYDVRVGDGLVGTDGFTHLENRIAEVLTTKRIDVLCRVDGRARIIEVRVRAGTSVIGNLLAYRELFAGTYPNEQPAEMFLVTDFLQSDMKGLLATNNINYIEV